MFTPESVLDLYERAHGNLRGLLTHCRQLSRGEIDHEFPGFGYPTVRLQLHHAIGGERYWLGVLEGRMDVDDDDPDYPTIESLEALREQVFAATTAHVRGLSVEQLNTPRPMVTWGDRQRVLTPVHVILRTQMHYYHHQGQVVAMCRLMGKPSPGFDYPIE